VSDRTELPDRRLLILVPSAFMAALAIGLINLGMLFVLKEAYGASPVIVGWFAALYSLAYFAGCLGLRPLSTRIRADHSMALSGILAALALAFHVLTKGLLSAFLAYGVVGFSTALFWPRLMGWLTTAIEGAALGRASGAFSVSWSVGASVAPFLAGLMAERGLFVPVYAAIVVFALTALFILSAAHLARPPHRESSPKPGEALDRSTPLRFSAWIGLFLIYAFIAVFLNVFPLYGRDELGLSESSIGLILLVRAASMAIGFWIVGRLSFWHFRASMIPLGLIAAALVDLAFLFIRSPLGFAAGLAAAGLVQAALYGASIFYGASGAPDRDRRVTIHESLLTAGQILGSLIGAFIYQLVSWQAVFVWIGAAIAVGVAAQVQLLRRGR